MTLLSLYPDHGNPETLTIMTGLSSLFQYANSLINSCLSILAFLGVGRDLHYFLRNFLRKFCG